MINTQTEQIIKEVVKKVQEERNEKENHFKEWGIKKVQIDEFNKTVFMREREVWWVSIGYNIGTEIFGKGKSYSRPVLVINAEGINSFIGIPMTSKLKSGKYNCIINTINDKKNTALTYQIRTFDKKRLLTKIGMIDTEEFEKVKKTLRDLCKI